jgi:CMD domain protein
MATVSEDIINRFAGIAPGSPLAQLREQRHETLGFAQGSFAALLEPEDSGGVSQVEREAIGLRVATLELFPDLAEFHRDCLRVLGVPDPEIDAVENFPDGELPARLVAILRHTDLLTADSRSGSPEALSDLKLAGLTAQDIVTISQLIAYLNYQIRMIALLRAMGGQA